MSHVNGGCNPQYYALLHTHMYIHKYTYIYIYIYMSVNIQLLHFFPDCEITRSHLHLTHPYVYFSIHVHPCVYF